MLYALPLLPSVRPGSFERMRAEARSYAMNGEAATARVANLQREMAR